MMEYIEAKKLADRLLSELQPHCEKIDIAGSIRREKQSRIKDVELVCIPNRMQLGQFALFGNTQASAKSDVSSEFRIAVAKLGTVAMGKPDGKYMKIELPEGVNLDLFMPSDFDYYRQLAIRTGSADFSKNMLAVGWSKIGWCGSDLGLRRKEDCIRVINGWKCTNQKAELPPVWTSEREFFQWLGLEWVEPKDRI